MKKSDTKRNRINLTDSMSLAIRALGLKNYGNISKESFFRQLNAVLELEQCLANEKENLLLDVKNINETVLNENFESKRISEKVYFKTLRKLKEFFSGKISEVKRESMQANNYVKVDNKEEAQDHFYTTGEIILDLINIIYDYAGTDEKGISVMPALLIETDENENKPGYAFVEGKLRKILVHK